ncbi:MAG: sodium/proton antiporter NhaB [Gammaproteobacteria bacterium]
MLATLFTSFLGASPRWYKQTILALLVLNVPLLVLAGPAVTTWVLLLEFIFTLAMALKCYPLQPGGLLALQAVLLGLVSPEAVYAEVVHGFPVILLLIFMVAGIHFLRDGLLFLFSGLLVRVRSQTALALLFCGLGALLSAFLDALTVLAVIITVAVGCHQLYHRVASAGVLDLDHDPRTGDDVLEFQHADLEQFRAFLRGLLMHAAVGTTLGGVCTMVGEPQNLLVAKAAGWDFAEFFWKMAPVTMPVLAIGLLTCVLVERFRWFGYGAAMPEKARAVLEDAAREQRRLRTPTQRWHLIVQALVAVLLVLGLALHVAEVGLVGLLVIVLATAFCGVTDEHRLGEAFTAALPFTALLVVFFVIVGAIHHQDIFGPVVHWVLTLEGRTQAGAFYLANGLLSAISDNVFVASIYIGELQRLFAAGELTREQFDLLAVAVNTGTNIPSIATPNGQAAFLFLLTSSVAPLVRLGYGRMCWMALPYLLTMAPMGLVALMLWY